MRFGIRGALCADAKVGAHSVCEHTMYMKLVSGQHLELFFVPLIPEDSHIQKNKPQARYIRMRISRIFGGPDPWSDPGLTRAQRTPAWHSFASIKGVRR